METEAFKDVLGKEVSILGLPTHRKELKDSLRSYHEELSILNPKFVGIGGGF